jgi:hypothetical protein
MVKKAVSSIEQANKTAEGYANRSRRDFQFGRGDGVLLSTKYFIPEAFRDQKRKLEAKFAGPYEIIEVISPVAYRLRLPVGTKAHDVFHASTLNPCHGDGKTERTTLPPLPVVMRDGEEEFEVESVVSYRRHRGKPQYMIKKARVASIGVNVGKHKDLTHNHTSRFCHRKGGTFDWRVWNEKMVHQKTNIEWC